MSNHSDDEKELIYGQFDELIANCPRCQSEEDLKLIQKAFGIAYESHKGVRRKSGEPYILHPIAVARIVAHEIGLDSKSIACALLHDVVEDTDYTIDDIERLFGKTIAKIIDGLTKISEVFDANSSAQAENFRKILLTLSDDIRVIFIKLADRLHNMRTLDSLPEHKKMKIAGETIYLYAPLAHRLGLYTIKTELEDLSLKHRYPAVYEDIKVKIEGSEKRRMQLINSFSLPIIHKLEENNIEFEINGRPKSIYSIWKKIQTKNVAFEDIYDLLAIRIIFEPYPHIPEKTQCWHIYSLISDIYKPKPDRIRDWVSTPKANGYEALHCTVMGPHGQWIEVQIRSRRMNEIAERGFASHWKYKSDDHEQHQESELDKWIKQIRVMLENPQTDALEFLDEFKLNLFTSEIIVFTPKGETRTLPKGATALDLAYEIHSEIGNKAIGAKVNHKLVPLSHVLNSGDQVEIITAATQKPSWDALKYVSTAKAKSAIKVAYKAETKNRIEKGKNLVEEKLAELGVPPSSRVFKKIIPAYDVLSKEELYSKVGSGLISLDNLKKILKKNTKNKWVRYWELRFQKNSQKIWRKKSEEAKEDKLEVKGTKFDPKQPFLLREFDDEENTSYVVARCCNPIPGDDVIGYLTLEENVIIHKVTCAEAIRLMSSHGDRIVAAKWTQHKVLSFLARIEVLGMDRLGILSELVKIISDELKVNIRKFNIESHDGVFESTIDLYVHDSTSLNNLIGNVMKIKGVYSVKRIEQFDS